MRALFVILLCGAVNAFAQSTSSLTDNTVVNAGSSQVQNVNGTGNTQSFAINAGSAPAQLPLTTQTGAVPSPGIFGPLGNTPGAASIPFVAAVQEMADITYTRQYQAKPLIVDGKSGQTILSVRLFPATLSKEDSDVLPETIKAVSLSAKVYQNVIPLAVITTFTKSNAGDKTDWSVIEADVQDYSWGMKGYANLIPASLLHSVSAASGVETAGWNVTAGAVLGKILSAASSGGLAPSGSIGSGKTNPTSFPGGSFVIFAAVKSGGMTFDMRVLREYFAPVRLEPVLVPAPTTK